MGQGTKNTGGDTRRLSEGRCSWPVAWCAYNPNMTSAISPRPAPFTLEPWAR